MKKVTKIVTLVATGLVALGAGPVSLAVATNVGAGAATEAAYSPVLVEADEDVTVNVPLVAKVGQTVKVQLAYNAKNYSVSAVTVNGELAAKVDDNNFYFVAPAGNINLKVEGHKIGVPSGTTTGYVVLNGSEAQGIYFQGIPETAQAGDEVVFSVGLAPDTPYSWTGNVYAFKLNNKGQKQGAVEVLKVGENKFSLIMPEGHVGLFADAEARAYFLTFNEELGSNLDKVEVKPEGSNKFTKVSTPYFIQAGSEVKATFKDTKGTVVKSCTGLGTTVEFGAEDATKAVTFTMPAKKVDLNVVLDITYYQLTLDESDDTNKFEWTFRQSDTSSGTYTEVGPKGITYGKYVRAYWTQKEGIAQKPKTVLCYYDGTSGRSVTASAGSDDFGPYVQWNINQESDFRLKVTALENPLNVVVTKTTDHISAKLVKKVNGAWVESPYVYASEYAYVQFTRTSSEYGIGSPKFKYSTSSTNNLIVNDEANLVYRSNTALSSTSYTYTLDFTELTKVFTGAEFLGKYPGFNFYQATALNSGASYTNPVTANSPLGSYGWEINEFATGLKGSTAMDFQKTENTTMSGQTELRTKTSSGSSWYKILVSKNWIIGHYSPSSDVMNANDFALGCRLFSDTTATIYTRCYNTSYGVCQVVKNNEVLDTMFVVFNSSTKKPENIYLTGVTTTTTNVAAAASYQVSVNGTVIGTVSGQTFTKA